MLHLANLKVAILLKQQAATNAATLTSDQLDMRGSDYVKLIVHATTSDAATNNPSVLKVQESDTTDASNFADITELVGDGASGFTIPNSPTATTTKPFAIFNISWGGNRKRYLRALVSPVTTQTFSLVAIQGRMKTMPIGTTEENAAVVVNT